MLSFQDIIFNLERYWSRQGCVVLQPYDAMMGAGTFHWATTLKAVGPEPWRVAYVQPSRRPTDGRYGVNPFRMQHFFQLQVLLKPSPADSKSVFLESLKTVGLDYRNHDIRFVEDDWESPTLGAAGLGWEVWCDGMEICQFTYFQRVGGLECRPTSTELTYGLERIAMFIQNRDNVYDVLFDRDGTLYGDVFRERERQFSIYNFEQADVTELKRRLETCKSECRRLATVDPVLPLVAYDFCVEASHLFNVLDARNEVSHQMRAATVLSIRELASLCCKAYLREEKRRSGETDRGENP